MSSKKHGASRGHGGHDEEHEEHVNHEAWVIPYADMLTLLMALFLVLFAIGRVDTEKFKALAESLHSSITGSASSGAAPPDPVTVDTHGGGSSGILDGGVTSIVPTTTVLGGHAAAAEDAYQHEQQAAAAANAEIGTLNGVKQMVQDAADAHGLGKAVAFRMEGRGLVVTVITDTVMFQPGRADLEAGGAAILDIVADSLADTDYHLAIEGHTDSRPISTSRYPTNWELSTARATTVLRYLVDRHGFSPARLSAAGYADTKPIAQGSTPADQAKNRRVEIVVLSKVTLPEGSG